MNRFLVLLLISIFISCKTEKENNPDSFEPGEAISVDYATGFSITQFEGYKLLDINDPWPGAERTFRYLLVEDQEKVAEGIEYDQKINIPVKRIVVTSTTHIPSLEILGEETSLVGFPGLDYISSQESRKRINRGDVVELGNNESINTEMLIALEPDVVVGFAVNGNNKTFNTIEKSGIPVVFNGDWIEDSPLGKAEWIKFFGALYNKTEQAERFFSEIAANYIEARSMAESAGAGPTVLSGSMYKDQWYVPYGNSWQAKFLQDANSNYIYEDTNGSGSIALSFESVLSEAQNAEFWVAPGQYYSYQQLKEASPHYEQFRAVKEKNVYTYSNTKGGKGGVIYYELAPVRPDLVLKDLISIFHPELLPDYQKTFYKALE